MFSGSCPLCQGEMAVSEFRCTSCGAVLRGAFGASPLLRLSPEENEFVITFLLCRGNIRAVEKELGISYPTVKARLQRVVERLGWKVEEVKDDRREERFRVLEELREGRLSAKAAAERLRRLSAAKREEK